MKHLNYWQKQGIIPFAMQSKTVNTSSAHSDPITEQQPRKDKIVSDKDTFAAELWRQEQCIAIVFHDGKEDDALFGNICKQLRVISKPKSNSSRGRLHVVFGEAVGSTVARESCRQINLESLKTYREKPEKKAELWQALAPLWPTLE